MVRSSGDLLQSVPLDNEVMMLRRSLKRTIDENPTARDLYARMLRHTANALRRSGRAYDAVSLYCRLVRNTKQLEDRFIQDLNISIQANCHDCEGQLLDVARNKFLTYYHRSRPARLIREEFLAQPLEDRVRLRYRREAGDPARQGNLILLKAPDRGTGEKGVILLKYNTTFSQFPALFDLPRLAASYRLVLEPSYSVNAVAPIVLFIGSDLDVVVQCNHELDRGFYSRIGRNFLTIGMGAGEWVDPTVFTHNPDVEKTFDVVMVANWAHWKRHEILFSALASLHPERYRLALIGYPLERTRGDIERLLRRFGLEKDTAVFESIPPQDVARILTLSKVAVMLSREEGPNKGIYEAFFCGTPVILYAGNVGVNRQHLNEMTGIAVSDDQLPAAIRRMVENHAKFAPREWASQNVGCMNATGRLNDLLRDRARSRGEVWTRDIVPKVNRPNLRYGSERDRLELEPGYRELENYLLTPELRRSEEGTSEYR